MSLTEDRSVLALAGKTTTHNALAAAMWRKTCRLCDLFMMIKGVSLIMRYVNTGGCAWAEHQVINAVRF